VFTPDNGFSQYTFSDVVVSEYDENGIIIKKSKPQYVTYTNPKNYPFKIYTKPQNILNTNTRKLPAFIKGSEIDFSTLPDDLNGLINKEFVGTENKVGTGGKSRKTKRRNAKSTRRHRKTKRNRK
jgi:hypothetical protein